MARKALLISAKDNVATALTNLVPDEVVKLDQTRITIREPIPLGHKFAVHPLKRGEKIVKYGEVIGQSTAAIARGAHVHVHNLESLRGRGDRR